MYGTRCVQLRSLRWNLGFFRIHLSATSVFRCLCFAFALFIDCRVVLFIPPCCHFFPHTTPRCIVSDNNKSSSSRRCFAFCAENSAANIHFCRCKKEFAPECGFSGSRFGLTFCGVGSQRMFFSGEFLSMVIFSIVWILESRFSDTIPSTKLHASSFSCVVELSLVMLDHATFVA